MKRTKLAAFTITELLAVMVISSILLTSATLLYTNVSRYQLRLQKRIDQVNAVNRIKFLLAKDLKNYSDFHLEEEMLVSSRGNLIYQFTQDSVIRQFGDFTEVFYTGATFNISEDKLNLRFSLYEQAIVVSFNQKKAYRDNYNSNQGEKKVTEAVNENTEGIETSTGEE